MPIWRLPDNFSDVLPTEARQLEALRHHALDILRTWGYELVTPPLLENLSALTTGTAQDLEAVMFKVVDPVTGALLGLRADVTPQAARIDAHLLNRTGPTRLCYCTPALRSQVLDAFAQRELLQLGAELFGHSGIEADIEIQDLALYLLEQLGITVATQATTLALSHSGILTAIFIRYPELMPVQAAILNALRTKNQTQLNLICKNLPNNVSNIPKSVQTQPQPAPEPLQLLTLLIQSYGSIDAVMPAQFAEYPDIAALVATLHDLAKRAIATGLNVVIDLADLSGYGYHTGVQFAVYVNGLNTSLLRGGRYDCVGEAFGRARAATGFSLDLRTLAGLLPARIQIPAILAPWLDVAAQPTQTNHINNHINNQLDAEIATLRQQGHVVVRSLPGHACEQDEFLCDRSLVYLNGSWQVQAI